MDTAEATVLDLLASLEMQDGAGRLQQLETLQVITECACCTLRSVKPGQVTAVSIQVITE